MNRQMSEVMQRRGELLVKIAAQRQQIAQLGARWQIPLGLADRGLVVVRSMRSHPLLVAGIAALLVMRRRGMPGLMQAAWSLWKTYRTVSDFSKRFRV